MVAEFLLLISHADKYLVIQMYDDLNQENLIFIAFIIKLQKHLMLLRQQRMQ